VAQEVPRLSPSELRRLKDLEREGNQLKKLAAELNVDKEIHEDILQSKTLRPALKRELLFEALEDYEVYRCARAG
jgi:hypothetical protein